MSIQRWNPRDYRENVAEQDERGRRLNRPVHPHRYTLREVGKMFGMGTESVRQVEIAAIAKMRTRLLRDGAIRQWLADEGIEVSP